MDAQALQTLVYNLTQPLHKQNIHTLDMDPWRREVQIITGPTILTVALQLCNPERDLARALKAGPAMETHVASALRLQPGARWPIRVAASGAYLLVEVPRPNPWRPTYGELAKQATESVLLGVDAYTQPVALDLQQEMPGVLVVGRSGSGKTNAMRLLAAQAAVRGWELWLIDLKGGEEWRDLIPLAGGRFATDEEQAAALLSRLVARVRARNSGRELKAGWILLVVDEVSNLERKEQHALARLVKEGRSALLRSVIGNQRCGEEIHRMILANLTWRLTGLVSDATESYLATNLKGAGADSLQGRGDMLFVEDGLTPRRLQVARADASDMAPLLSQAAPSPSPIFEPTPHALAKPAMTLSVAYLKLLKSDPGDPPPLWLCGVATSYAMRKSAHLSYDRMTDLHKARTGKSINYRRRQVARRVAAEVAGLPL